MQINQGTQQSLLLQNSFKSTIFELKFYYRWNVVVKSNDLGLFRIGNDRLLRLELIKYLNKNGYSNREISDFLKISNIKKIRTNTPYTPKDIFMSLKKYNQRLNRIKNNQIISLRERLFVEKFFKQLLFYF